MRWPGAAIGGVVGARAPDSDMKKACGVRDPAGCGCREGILQARVAPEGLREAFLECDCDVACDGDARRRDRDACRGGCEEQGVCEVHGDSSVEKQKTRWRAAYRVLNDLGRPSLRAGWL